MMKAFTWVLLLFLIFLSACSTRIHLYSRQEFLERVNLIENSGFEITDDLGSEMPNGWLVLDNYQNMIFVDENISHTGNNSLKIKKPLQDINLTSDSFQVDPTCSYYCRCFIKATKRSKDPVVFYFFTFNQDSKQVNRFSKRIYPSPKWQEVDITTSRMNEDSAFGRIVLSIPQEADINIWIDDVESYTICDF